MKRVMKYIVRKTYKPLLVKYLTKTRSYTYKEISLEIPPQVFHPGFFSSTKLLLRFISKEHLKQSYFLELGAGSGLLSIYAARKGSIVTATDINPVAINCLEKNAQINGVNIEIIYSDLFERIPARKFDFILINPPYYKKDPLSQLDYAWYCGKNGEYFQKLFSGLRSYVHDDSKILMVLCDGCDLAMIKKYALANSFSMECVYEKSTLIETNYIFQIRLIQ